MITKSDVICIAFIYSYHVYTWLGSIYMSMFTSVTCVVTALCIYMDTPLIDKYCIIAHSSSYCYTTLPEGMCTSISLGCNNTDVAQFDNLFSVYLQVFIYYESVTLCTILHLYTLWTC